MQSRQSALALSLLVGGLTLVVPMSAVADDGDGPPADVPDGMSWDPQHGLQDDALAGDAEAIAEDRGVSAASVLQVLRAQAQMNTILPVASIGIPRWSASIGRTMARSSPSTRVNFRNRRLTSCGRAVRLPVRSL